jgi:hypothetical protein
MKGILLRLSLAVVTTALVLAPPPIWPERVENANTMVHPSSFAPGRALAASKAKPASKAQRVHGHVAAIGGSTMDLKADDGRNLVVQMGQISGDVLNSLKAGDTVTVTGALSGTTLEAKSVQKDKK